MDTFKKIGIQFFEPNSLHIKNLTTLLQNDQLDAQQWQLACDNLDTLMKNISNTIQEGEY
jgi:hypothetical protein